MIIRTKSNHFKYGDVRGKFSPSYGQSQRPALDFHSECVIAAREIQKAYGKKKIALLMSGGIDSEIMARSFLAAKVPMIARILRLKDDKNIHDWTWAVAWCEANKVAYQFYDFDPIEFFESGEYLQYAKLSQCCLFSLLPIMKMLEDVVRRGEIPVMGSGECYLEYTKKQGWTLFERRKFVSFHRFLDQKKMAGIPSFFQWSPELMNSFLLDEMIQNLVLSLWPEYNSTLPIKQELYAAHFPGLPPRPKYFGYEKLLPLLLKANRILEKKYPQDLQEALLPYGGVVKKLSGKVKSKK